MSETFFVRFVVAVNKFQQVKLPVIRKWKDENEQIFTIKYTTLDTIIIIIPQWNHRSN